MSITQDLFSVDAGHKNIEVLLQRMFEGELESESSTTNTGATNAVTLSGATESSVRVWKDVYGSQKDQSCSTG